MHLLEIKFEINGRVVNADNVGDALGQACLAAVEEYVRAKLDGIRDPDTGEFPVVAVHGRDLEHLSFAATGSARLVELVRAALEDGQSNGDGEDNVNKLSGTPRAFLCHSTKNLELAERLARDLQANGIETFFAQWDIGDGDSIRQTIDDGIESCTHFIALLTAESIQAPWVKTEMDAAFMRRVQGRCRFIPLRWNLAAEALPPLLAAIKSPSLSDDYGDGVRALVNGIHGVSQKPPLGVPPAIMRQRPATPTGLSAAAECVARLFIERSKYGQFGDPQFGAKELHAVTELPIDDLVDAVDELEGRGLVRKAVTMGFPQYGFAALMSEPALFAELDQHFMEWNPEADAARLAAELVNGNDGRSVPVLAEGLGWTTRRMNPALAWLIARDLVDSSEALTYPWLRHWISKTHKTRRFLTGRG
jgi:hypothetical protein